MKNTNASKIYFSLTAIIYACSMTQSVNADFDVIARNSEIRLESTNLGGVDILVGSTNTNLPFAAQIFDSVTHEEPSGNINGGFWNGSQESSVSPQLIRADLQSEVLTQQVFGMGIPVLDMVNQFEVEFQVNEETEIEIGGTMLGTADVINADDFVRARLQFHNGVTFLNMFTTSTLDDLNSLYVDTFQPGVLYRLTVESHADSIGAQANASRLTICLRERSTTGDMNQDGVVNLLDINPFVDTLTAGDYDGQADTNCDGMVDLTDVAPFVAILSGN